MRSVDVVELLQRHGLRVFTSSDLVTLTELSPAAATQCLRRLDARGLVARIKKGVWVNRVAPGFHAYEAVAALQSPWPAYVSLYSALADAGLVEEIPEVVYGVSSGRARRWRTPVGDFRISHLPARLMWGFEAKHLGQGACLLAEPEKAFLDTVYLALIPRSPIGFPHKRERRWRLDGPKLRRYAKRFAFPPLSRWLRENRLI